MHGHKSNTAENPFAPIKSAYKIHLRGALHLLKNIIADRYNDLMFKDFTLSAVRSSLSRLVRASLWEMENAMSAVVSASFLGDNEPTPRSTRSTFSKTQNMDFGGSSVAG